MFKSAVNHITAPSKFLKIPESAQATSIWTTVYDERWRGLPMLPLLVASWVIFAALLSFAVLAILNPFDFGVALFSLILAIINVFLAAHALYVFQKGQLSPGWEALCNLITAILWFPNAGYGWNYVAQHGGCGFRCTLPAILGVLEELVVVTALGKFVCAGIVIRRQRRDTPGVPVGWEG